VEVEATFPLQVDLTGVDVDAADVVPTPMKSKTKPKQTQMSAAVEQA
jgi:hypothetical protein